MISHLNQATDLLESAKTWARLSANERDPSRAAELMSKAVWCASEAALEAAKAAWVGKGSEATP